MTTPDGHDVDIDTGLADLLAETWATGAATNWSCQDHGEAMAVHPWSADHLQAYRRWYLGYAVIDFRTPNDLTDWLTAVARGGPRDDFYLRIVHWAAPGAWRTGACIRDLAVARDDNHQPPGQAEFVVSTGRVYFPSTDIPEAAERLRRLRDGYTQPPTPIDWDSIAF